MATYYDILEIKTDSTIDDIKRAYRILALKYHPDKCGGNSDKFQKIKEAYDILSDTNKRLLYDSTINLDSTNELMSKFINIMLDLLKDKLKKNTKTKETNKESDDNMNQYKSKIIKLNIPITLDELYKASIKKIVINVKRKDGYKKINLYISLINYDRKIIFENTGDEDENGNRDDIEIILDIKKHDKFMIDDILSKYDILYIGKSISLYEYYYGVNDNIEYLNGESIDIESNYVGHFLMKKIDGKGLCYSKDDQIMRGNLYIYYDLKLPDKDSLEEENLKKYFNK